MSRGRIKRLIPDRGFGFIETTQGEDLFFHCSKLREIEFVDLHENQIVEFEVAQFPQGLQAVNVRPSGGDAEHAPPGDWAPSAEPPRNANFASGHDPFETGPRERLTQREQLLIRLAVNMTRGHEGSVREQMDAARQLGLDRATLSEIIDRVSKANADVCRAITVDSI